MEKIGVGAFGDCSSLVIVHLPTGVSKIASIFLCTSF